MNESFEIFSRENALEQPEINRVARIADRYAHIKSTMVKPTCDMCGETIWGQPIEIEVEMNFPGNEGAPEYDAPVTRHFCNEECKKEYYEK